MRSSSVILLSSGLDSLATFYWALEETDIVMALTLDYGQKAAKPEINQSKELCQRHHVAHRVIELPWMKESSPSHLIDANQTVPKLSPQDLDDKSVTKESADKVWVPNRNGVFLQVASFFAEAYFADCVLVGFNQEEAETFPDNSVAFIDATNKSLQYSTRSKVTVQAPMAKKNKSEILEWLMTKDESLSFIWSCYLGGETMCGQCESCQRLKRALLANKQESRLKALFES